MNGESRHDQPAGLDESQLDRLLREATRQPILLPAGLERRIETSVRRAAAWRRVFACAAVAAGIAAALTVLPTDAPAPIRNVARHMMPGEGGAQRPTSAAAVVTVQPDDANVIAVAIETGNSAVTIVWLYPIMQTSASRPAVASDEPIR